MALNPPHVASIGDHGSALELGHANFATVFTPGGSVLRLQVAYRLARVAALADAVAGDDGVQIDRESARRAVTDVRQAMTRVGWSARSTSAIGAINRASSRIQDLVDTVLSALRRLDDILGAFEGPPAGWELHDP